MNFSGLSPGQVESNKGARLPANWRARYFLPNKKIQTATVTAIYKTGFSVKCHQSLPVGDVINLEFVVRYQDAPTRVRIKGKIDYCLLKNDGSGAEVEVSTLKISDEDQLLVNHLIKTLISTNKVNFRI